MSIENPAKEAPTRRAALDWRSLTQSPEFVPVVAVVAAFLFAFWPFVAKVWGLWFAEDSYYAHGAIVPLCSLFLIYDRWENLRRITVRGFWPAIVLLLPSLYLGYVAQRTVIQTVSSFAFVASLISAVLFLAGWRWLWALAGPILYLVFALPVWQAVIDRMTVPLQDWSSTLSYYLLKLGGMEPFRAGTNTIVLPNFTLEVAVACSGLKLALAVVAISVFFVMAARLRWWANALLLASSLPLAVVINGIRVALIGVVGNQYGGEAGIRFHDTSGYIALVLCFAILYKFTKALGWK